MTLPNVLDPEIADAVRQTLLDSGVDASKLEDVGPEPDADDTKSTANAQIKPNEAEDDGLDEKEELKQLAIALYGTDYPGIRDDVDAIVPADWVSWGRGRWDSHGPAVAQHLHLVRRNRLMRSGRQWVSSRNGGPWREPLKPVDAARIVNNVEEKALDQRLQIITDQRPGFTVSPQDLLDPAEKRKAKARQLALEFQYNEQGMDQQMRVAGYWAQTDGVSFWHTFWDSQAGPWDIRMSKPDGDQWQLNPKQSHWIDPTAPDANGVFPSAEAIRKPLGDLRTVTHRVEQVRVSANATMTEAPYYVIIKEIIPATESAYRYGYTGVQDAAQASVPTGNDEADSGMNRWVLDQTTVGEGDRLRNQPTVERFTIYVEPHPDILPDGLQMVTVGDAVVWGPGPLLFGVIPVADVRDGSSDPSYFPRAIQEQWHDIQVRINALKSAIVESIRVNKAGRFLARAGAITQETFVGGGTSILEVNGANGLDDIVKPVQGFSVGEDVWRELADEYKQFENATGWNDASRGQIDSDASGRAILANREQLERIFAPPVQAVAQAYTKWAKIQLGGMAWGYDIPRNMATVGADRPDLARALSAEDFEGPASVKVEADTLMPMPSSYRRFIMDSYLQRGLITPQQYMRNEHFPNVNDFGTPDEDQEARAKRVCDAIRTGTTIPEVRWQDNEAIHQDVLEREIILQDDLAPQIVMTAQERWAVLAEQAKEKAGGAAPPPDQGGPQPAPVAAAAAAPGAITPAVATPPAPPAAAHHGGAAASPFTPSPTTQPLATSAPAVSAAPPGATLQSPHAPA